MSRGERVGVVVVVLSRDGMQKNPQCPAESELPATKELVQAGIVKAVALVGVEAAHLHQAAGRELRGNELSQALSKPLHLSPENGGCYVFGALEGVQETSP